MKEFLIELYTTDGRWNRKKYFSYQILPFLWILVFSFIFSIILSSISYLGKQIWVSEFVDPAVNIIWIIKFFIVVVLCIWIDMFWKVKRLHDLDRSWWWYFLTFVPIVSIFVMIYIFFFHWTKWPNQYGPDPLEEKHKIELKKWEKEI